MGKNKEKITVGKASKILKSLADGDPKEYTIEEMKQVIEFEKGIEKSSKLFDGFNNINLFNNNLNLFIENIKEVMKSKRPEMVEYKYGHIRDKHLIQEMFAYAKKEKFEEAYLLKLLANKRKIKTNL